MKRILSLDGDVLMLKNTAVWFNDVLLALTEKEHHFTNSNGVLTVDDSFYDIINISLGAVGLFSERGLLSFASYIDNWFLNDNAGTHNTIHTNVTHAKKDKSRYGKYLSDMMLQREFISLNTTVSNNCYEFMKGELRFHFIFIFILLFSISQVNRAVLATTTRCGGSKRRTSVSSRLWAACQ
jgi:hypothetical protein